MKLVYPKGACHIMCMECEPGRFQQHALGGFHCSECPWGKFQRKSGKVACLACPNGKYAPIKGSTACLVQSATACSAGTYLGWATQLFGAHTKVCLSCPAGKYSTAAPDSAHAGVGCWHCPNGQWNLKAGMTQCFGCHHGTELHASGCVPCRSGSFGDKVTNPNRHNGVGNCVKCPPGKFTLRKGNTKCHLCTVGRFAARVGSMSCNHCPQGKLQQFKGTGFCDSKVCPAGKFTVLLHALVGELVQSNHLVSCALCPTGQFQQRQGGMRCNHCPLGKFQPFSGQTLCFPSTQHCAAGRYVSCTGSDAIRCDGTLTCLRCPSGRFQPNVNEVACLPCHVGHTVTSDGAGCSKHWPTQTTTAAPTPKPPQLPFVALSQAEGEAADFASQGAGPMAWLEVRKTQAVLMEMKDTTLQGFPLSICMRMCVTTVGCNWWALKGQEPDCIAHSSKCKNVDKNWSCCGYRGAGTCFLLGGAAHNITGGSTGWTAGLAGEELPFLKARAMVPTPAPTPAAAITRLPTPTPRTRPPVPPSPAPTPAIAPGIWLRAPRYYWITSPFLHGGGSRLKKPTLAACAVACAADSQCATGTFVLSGTHKGECWLSNGQREARKACFEPCQSFSKLSALPKLTTSSPRAWYDEMFHSR